MATVTGYTAEHMEELFNEDIVSGEIVDNHLILTKRGGGTVDAGIATGSPGVTAEELDDQVGTGMLVIQEVGTEQFVPGFSADTWTDVTDLGWIHDFTPGRMLEIAFQVALYTQDTDGSDFDVRVMRDGGSAICAGSGSVRRDGHVAVVNGSRTFEVPGSWGAGEVIKVQARWSTAFNVYYASDQFIGFLTIEDKGTA